MTSKEASQWPTCAMLGWGTLGGPAGRRYSRHCAIALAVMVAGCAASALFGLKLVAALAPGAGFLYIAWEFRIYLAALDELARRIQLESIAWTYMSGLVAAILLGGLALVFDWKLNPMWFVVLEPVRSVWLYRVARRYQ